MQSHECLDLGIVLRIVWVDEDLVEVRVSGSNGCFAGTTDYYCEHEVFAQVASTLSGVPVVPRLHRFTCRLRQPRSIPSSLCSSGCR